MKSGKWSIIFYVALAYLLSYGMAYAISETGGKESSLLGLLILSMLVPAMVAVLARFVFHEGFGDVNWRAFHFRWAVFGMLLFPVVAWVVVPAYLLFSGQDLAWASWLQPGADGLITPPEATGLGEAFKSGELQEKLLFKLLFNLPILCVFTLGEEFGWRSFLQTRLTAQVGARSAILWTALIWAYWHLGFYSLDLHETSGIVDWLGVLFIAPLSLAGVGVVFGWLYHRTGSLWVIVLAHAGLNKWTAVPLRYLEHADGGESALLVYSFVPIVIGALWLWRMPIHEPPPAAEAAEG